MVRFPWNMVKYRNVETESSERADTEGWTDIIEYVRQKFNNSTSNCGENSRFQDMNALSQFEDGDTKRSRRKNALVQVNYNLTMIESKDNRQILLNEVSLFKRWGNLLNDENCQWKLISTYIDSTDWPLSWWAPRWLAKIKHHEPIVVRDTNCSKSPTRHACWLAES